MSHFATSGETTPTHDAARSARDSLELCARVIRQVPLEMDRERLSERLHRAMEMLYAALESSVTEPAHRDGLGEAALLTREMFDVARNAGDPSVVLPLGRVLGLLDYAARTLDSAAEQAGVDLLERRLANPAQLAPQQGNRQGFQASFGLPTLHYVERKPLFRSYSLDPLEPIAPPKKPRNRLPRPKGKAEIAAFRARAKGAVREEAKAAPERWELREFEKNTVPAEESDARRIVARALLESIATLGLLRPRGLGERWTDAQTFEQRLLAALDAFVSLGSGVLPLISLFHKESRTPDFTRAFAVALTLACIEGEDVLDVVVGVLLEADQAEYPGFVEALSLASNPQIDRAIAYLLDLKSEKLVIVALEILLARGGLPQGSLPALLARNSPPINTLVARALAHSYPREVAVPHLEDLAFDPDSSLDVFVAASESLLQRRHGPTREFLRKTVGAKDADFERVQQAAVLLALSGSGTDNTLLVQTVERYPTPTLIDALSRHGHLNALNLFVDLLGHEDDAVSRAAAFSLQRMLGVGPTDVVQTSLDPDRPAFLAPAPTQGVVEPSRDPLEWEEVRLTRTKGINPAQKFRNGRPYEVAMSVDELANPVTPHADRLIALQEILFATGSTLLFSTTTWVRRQQDMLPLLREDARRVAAMPGAWCFAGMGMRSK